MHYSCGKCDKVYPSKHSFAMHQKVHKPYFCRICEKVHLLGDKPHSCNAIARGAATAHQPDDKKWAFTCEVCGQYFVTKGGCMHHKRKTHTDEKPFSCELCNVYFYSRARLKVHRCPLKYNCAFCKKVYTSTALYDLHKCQQDSADEGYVSCGTCNRIFVKECYLKRHQQMSTCGKESPPKKDSYPCDKCNCVFSEECFLKKHQLFHECSAEDSISDPESAAKDTYPCDKCDRVFYRERNLKIHKHYHNNKTYGENSKF